MGDWLDDRHKEQRDKIMALNPKPGQFAQLRSHFGDVWCEIVEIDEFWAKIYTWRRDTIGKRYYDGTDRELTYNIRTVVDKIPPNARIIYTSKGGYGATKSEKNLPLSDFPKECRE